MVATIRRFDPKVAYDKPVRAYQAATKAMNCQDLFKLSKAALSAAEGPLCTRELARYVVKVQGWVEDDWRLYLTISSWIGATLTRCQRRGQVMSAA